MHGHSLDFTCHMVCLHSLFFFAQIYKKKNLLQGQCRMFCMRNEANKFSNLVELFSKLKVQVSQKLNKGGFPQKKSLGFKM